MQQDSDSTPQLTDTSQVPDPNAPATVPPIPAYLQPALMDRLRSRRALIVFAGVLAFVATVLMMVRRSSGTHEKIQVTRQVAAKPSTGDALVLADSEPAPAWVGRRQPGWASDGSKTIEFQLDAINDAPVWMTRVRPTLVARCLSRTTEIYIVIRTAASVETHPDVHTVHVQIDDGPDELQQWSGSQSQHELFAPNGQELVRRLAHAQRLRVAFKPYNSQSATADFFVRGFDRLAGLVASTCGWRLDDPADSRARRVSLNRP